MKRLPLVLLTFATAVLQAQVTPDLSAWTRNTSGITGYNGIIANVQRVRYSASSVYVDCSDIPSYTIGPWPGNPNTPSNQGFTFKIARQPQVNTGTKTATPLGQIGILINGVVIFNALDANSYNNQNIWHQNAVVVEGPSFDAALGHPAPSRAYHHHQNPKALYSLDSTRHSPLLGFAFDGYAIYGPYGYATANNTGAVKRMRSSYRIRNITQRTSLPDGTALPVNQYGPAVSTQFPLGYYVEDFEYTAGLGDLDQYNGRVAVTPDYPNGIYTYYFTLDSLGNSAYPYAVGPSYYGVVVAGNSGPNSGHVTVTEQVTEFTGTTGLVPADQSPTDFSLQQNYPNPFNPNTVIEFTIRKPSLVLIKILNSAGQEIATIVNEPLSQGKYRKIWDAKGFPSGAYFYRLVTPEYQETKKMALVR